MKAAVRNAIGPEWGANYCKRKIERLITEDNKRNKD
jgi:hypothetical protein